MRSNLLQADTIETSLQIKVYASFSLFLCSQILDFDGRRDWLILHTPNPCWSSFEKAFQVAIINRVDDFETHPASKPLDSINSTKSG